MRARHSWLLAAAALAVAFPLAVRAQEDVPSGDEPTPEAERRDDDDLDTIESITVTITRRAMDIHDVSSLVTAFDAETLRSANIDNQEDVVEMIPNVVTKGGRFNSISVRGLSSGITSQEAVAIHTNGVFTGPSSFYDIESVQFDRGPSGSLYGRNATAGALNVVWNKPQPEWAAWGEADIANYDQLRLRGGANIPLLGAGDERLMLRVNVQRNRYDGWLDSELETRNSDPGNANEWAFNGTLRSVISEDLEVSLRGRYAKLRNDVTPSRPLIDRYPVGRLPNNGILAGLGPIRSDPYNGFENTLDDLARELFGVLYALDPNIARGFAQANVLPILLKDPSTFGVKAQPLPDKIENVRTGAGRLGEPEIVRWGFDGEVRWSASDLPLLGDVDFKLIGGVFQADTDVQLDLDGTELEILDTTRDGRSRTWTGELQAVSQNDGRFNWVAGFFFFRTEGTVSQLVRTPFTNIPEEQDNRSSGAAPFAHFYFDWSESLQFEGGVRWSRDVGDRRVFRAANGVTVLSDTYLHVREVFRERTGDMTVRWNFNENSSVYAKYTRGYRPGGLNSGTGVQDTEDARLLSFDPEILDAYEVGTKNRLLDGLLQVNAAAFWYRYKNLQVPVVTVEGVFTQNAAGATIRGVELEMQMPFRSPIDFFEGGFVQAYVSYLHARYDQLCADDPFQNLAVSDPGCAPATSSFTGESDLSGNSLPDAPRWTSGLMAVLNKDMGDWGNLRFMVRSTFRDDYYLRQENLSEIDLVPNYTRTDFRIIWASPNERFSVHLYVENIEDRFQFASTLVGPELTGGLPVGLAIPLTPRKYGVQLEWTWEAD